MTQPTSRATCDVPAGAVAPDIHNRMLPRHRRVGYGKAVGCRRAVAPAHHDAAALDERQFDAGVSKHAHGADVLERLVGWQGVHVGLRVGCLSAALLLLPLLLLLMLMLMLMIMPLLVALMQGMDVI